MKKTANIWSLPATILLVVCLSHVAHAAKTDVVVLLNGDDVTGEIKSLEFGELRYSTDSMGTVSINWEEVVSITSDQSLQIEVTSGTRYFGGLKEFGSDGSIGVGRGENIQEIDMASIVRITPIETDEKIWQRFEGSIKFGFDSDKASAVTNGYLNGNVRYRTRTYLLGLDISASFTDQKDAETTENQSIGLNYQRFRGNRWFTNWSATTEKNDAQGVDQRLSLGAGLGRYLVQSNNNQLSLLVGLVATSESLQEFGGGLPDLCSDPEFEDLDICADPAPTNPGENLTEFCRDPDFAQLDICADSESINAEAQFSFKYLHRRNEPSSDIIFNANIYPLLEDFSSFRSDSNLTLRREIIDDLFLDLSVYYTYLTNPAFGAENDDYGVVTSIGFSF